MQKKIIGLMLSIILAFEIVVPAWATTISGVRSQRIQTQQNLNEINGEISDIQTQRESANTELQTMNDELVDVLTSIGILEEEIEIKQNQINIAQGNLTKAQNKEEEQYESMKTRIKFMYEQGNMVYMQALLGAVNYSDMLSKAEYVEGIYSYDRQLLEEYVKNREAIEDIKETLVEEQSQMKTAEYELNKEKESLQLLVALKKRTVDDFDAQLEDAQKKADAFKQQLKQQTERIKKMEERERKKKKEEERKKKEQEEKEREWERQQQESQGGDVDGDGATTVDVNTGETEGGDVSTGDETPDIPDTETDYETDYEEDYDTGYEEDYDTDYEVDDNASLGQQVCDYACQFVGNPYVFGGTSLTEGADCSGFTQAVFAHFGISIPRDSTSQRSCGVAVSYEEAQPGDIICYAGHVALYLGNGEIVHASTEQTGITYGYATYRTILAVRRVI